MQKKGPAEKMKKKRLCFLSHTRAAHTVSPQDALSQWVCGNNGSRGELGQRSLVLLHINLLI